jgi:hypothetical protein
MKWYDILGVVLGIFAIPGLASNWIPIMKKNYKLFTILGFILAILAIIFAVVPFPDGQPTRPEIKIASPLNDASVPLEITVRGYTAADLSSNEHLYIVVEYGGVWWPQVGEISVGYSQTSQKYEFSIPVIVGQEGDIGKSFYIRALLVDYAVHQYFKNWFQQSLPSQDWPGLSIVETKQRGEVYICDSISVVRK